MLIFFDCIVNVLSSIRFDPLFHQNSEHFSRYQIRVNQPILQTLLPIRTVTVLTTILMVPSTMEFYQYRHNDTRQNNARKMQNHGFQDTEDRRSSSDAIEVSKKCCGNSENFRIFLAC